MYYISTDIMASWHSLKWQYFAVLQCNVCCMIVCLQNLIEVGSELIHFKNLPLWGEIDMVSTPPPSPTPHTHTCVPISLPLFQTSVSDHVADLFISIENLGEGLFLSSGGIDSIIASDNIGTHTHT